MSCLTFLGVLAFLAISVLGLDHNLVRKELDRSLLGSPHQQKDPLTMSLWRNAHKMDLLKPNSIFDEGSKRTDAESRIKLTAFEKRVVRVLRKLGLLDKGNTAERVVEALRKDKRLLRELKKLLDEVEEEDEDYDFFEEILELFGF